MRKYLGILFFVELIAVLLSIIAGIALGVQSGGFVGFLIALLISLIVIAPVVLIYAVNDLLDRVKILEDKLLKKKVLTKKDLQTDTEEPVIWENTNSHLQPTHKGKVVADENIELCNNCGYQLFEEDTECPYCHHKRK